MNEHYGKIESVIFGPVGNNWALKALQQYEQSDHREHVVLQAERLAYILRNDFNIRNGLEDRDEQT